MKASGSLCLLFIFALLLSECIKKDIPPTVRTNPVTDFGADYAMLGGEIISQGNSPVMSEGVCWSTSPNPVMADSPKSMAEVNYTKSTGEVFSDRVSLIPGQTYYIRAYAGNSAGTVYGNEITFTTLPGPLTLTAKLAENTLNSVKMEVTIVAKGDSTVTSRGVCWSPTNNPPTIADQDSYNGKGTGTFITPVSYLVSNTTYYVRPYAMNNTLVTYGNTITVKTLQSPVTITANVKENRLDSLIIEAKMVTTGDTAVTSKGICWSSSNNSPTIADNKLINGAGFKNFICRISPLIANTTYYLRPYVMNGTIITYGEPISATIISPLSFTSAVKEIKESSAIIEVNLTTSGDTTVTARGVCWNTTGNPTIIKDSRTLDGKGIGTFTSKLLYLSPNTTIYVRPYATHGAITTYGEVSTIKTLTALELSAHLAEIGADYVKIDVTILSLGVLPIIERGICWSALASPTPEDNKKVDVSGGSSFSITVSGFDLNTTYKFRAYAKTSERTTFANSNNSFTVRILPKVYTSIVAPSSSAAATLFGGFDYYNYAPITSRGACWSTSPHPTIADQKSTQSLEINRGYNGFVCSLSGLIPNTVYYLRAFVSNAAGTGYGNEMTFVPEQFNTPTISDADGNLYHTVTIGNQVWMVENLRTTKYRNGDAIPYVSEETAWQGLTAGAYCNLENDSINSALYGKLYNWYAVNDSRKIAPAGWHVPSDADWNGLVNYLKNNGQADLKKTMAAKSGWLNNTTLDIDLSNNNSSGFTALPAGKRGKPMYSEGSWWGSTESTDGALSNFLLSSYGYTNFPLIKTKTTGLAVRCIKD